jgi:hypothetical protein
MKSTYLVSAGWCFLTLMFLANGLYAIFSPRGWLGAWWTAHRSMGPETSSGSIRTIGVFLTLFGVYGAATSVKLLVKIIHVTMVAR